MPNNCTPVRYDNILAVKFLSPEEIVWHLPFNSLYAQTKFINSANHFRIPDPSKGIEVEADPDSIQLTISNKRTNAGVIYTNNLIFNLDYNPDNPSETDAILATLKNPHNILLTFSAESKAIVRMCDGVGYNFSHIEEDGEIKCSVSIANLTGIQRVVS